MAKESDACKIMSTDDKRNFAIGNPIGGISDVMNFNDNAAETKGFWNDIAEDIDDFLHWLIPNPSITIIPDPIIPGAGSGSLVDEPEIAL